MITTSSASASADHAGRDQRGELAQRMPGRAHETGSLGLQDAERRDVAREERGLHELGRREERLVVATGDDVAPDRAEDASSSTALPAG